MVAQASRNQKNDLIQDLTKSGCAQGIRPSPFLMQGYSHVGSSETDNMSTGSDPFSGTRYKD